MKKEKRKVRKQKMGYAKCISANFGMKLDNYAVVHIYPF